MEDRLKVSSDQKRSRFDGRCWREVYPERAYSPRPGAAFGMTFAPDLWLDEGGQVTEDRLT